MTTPPIAPPLPDTHVLPVAYALLDCLCVEVAASPGGEPCFCGLVPGSSVAMDWCDCSAGSDRCGMAYVRLDTIYPSARFPLPMGEPGNCAVKMAARFQVGTFRCVPVADGDGRNPPSAEAQSAAVEIQLGDMAAIRRAIDCCLV